MPATRPVTTEFAWDRQALRYRRRGQFVSARAVKLGIRRVIRNAQAEMRAIADEMIAGQLSVGDFGARMRHEIKNLHVAGAMAGHGGQANMDANDWLAVGRQLRHQYPYLDRFGRQADAGELDAAAIRRRTEMYVNSMNAAYEGGRAGAAVKAGYTQARNVLGDSKDHCRTKGDRPGCLDLTKRGFIPIDDMPLPGSRACLSGCQCSLAFRKRPLSDFI